MTPKLPRGVRADAPVRWYVGFVALALLLGALLAFPLSGGLSAQTDGGVDLYLDSSGNPVRVGPSGDGGDHTAAPYNVNAMNPHPCDKYSGLFSINPPKVDFEVTGGDEPPAALLTISKNMATPSLAYVNNRLMEAVPAWLQVEFIDPKGPGSVELNADPEGLEPGTYYAAFRVWIEWTNWEDATYCGEDPVVPDSSWYRYAHILPVNVSLRVGDCTPVIDDVSTAPESVDMGRGYSVLVDVSLPSECTKEMEVTVSAGETGWRSSKGIEELRGDTVNPSLTSATGEATQSKTLSPGGSATYIFQAMHTWDWTSMRDGRWCVDLLSVSDIISWTVPGKAGVLYSIMTGLTANPDPPLDLLRTYSLQVEAGTEEGHESTLEIGLDDARSPQVEVSETMQLAYVNMIHSFMGAGVATSIGVAVAPSIAVPIVGLPAVLGAFGAEIAGIANACALFDLATGRTLLAAETAGAPTLSTPPATLLNAPDSAGKTVALAMFDAHTHLVASMHYMAQAESAEAADFETLLQKAEAELRLYESALAAMDAQVDAYVAEIVALVDAEEAVVGTMAQDRVADELRLHGLPEFERTAFAELGFDAQFIGLLGDKSVEQAYFLSNEWADELSKTHEWRKGMAAVQQHYIEELRKTPPAGSEMDFRMHLPTVLNKK